MVMQGLARRLAKSTWLKTPLVVSSPSTSQTSTGETITTWDTVTTGYCHVEQITSSTGERDVNGQPIVETYTYIHVEPTLTILPTYRLTAGGVVYQVSKIANADETFKSTLRVLVVRA